MPDQKITVTDEMVARARESLRSYGWTVGDGDTGLRSAITAALDAAPTTDECPDPDDHVLARDYAAMSDRATQWQERAEQAEQERSNLERLVGHAEIRAREAEQGLSDLSERYREQGGALLRAESLTAREHLDAAWEAAHVPEDGIIPAGSEYVMRSHRTGRLVTPPHEKACVDLPAMEVTHESRLLDPPAPKRPEGAEEWDDELGEMPAASDLTAEQRARLADALAERDHALGVRVTEDGAR